MPAVNKIGELLRNRIALKTEVIHCFQQVANSKNQLEASGMLQFQQSLSAKLGVPMEAFGDMKLNFERFDFDGSGDLSINQAYKLVKFHLLDYRKRLGATASTQNIPFRADVGGYTILKNLGNGAYGFAKLARSKKGEEVCLKCFTKSKMQSSAVEDLTHEFEALKLLSCEVIAGATDFFQDVENYYMVCEVYRGGDWTTLKQR